MTIEEKINNARMNEFGLSVLSPDRIDRIEVVRWERCEPMKVTTRSGQKVITEYCFVIGELEWDDHEPCWELRSVGTRYLEYGTEELNRWLMDFCHKYKVEDGELKEAQDDD